VTAGADIGSKKMEIIDLNDPSKVCQPSGLDDYPIDEVGGASGGLLNNNIALICGGYDYNTEKTIDDCFAITDHSVEANVKLIQARTGAASVVLNGNTLWLTGGAWYNDTEIITKSTEFVKLTGTTPGPDLPLDVLGHCLVPLNDKTVLLRNGSWFHEVNSHLILQH
jgi:hypothetical protein